jgi:adenine-specific DNA methylase
MNSSADLVDDVRTKIQAELKFSDSIDHVNFRKIFLSRVNQFKINRKEVIIKCRGRDHGGVNVLFLHLAEFKFDSPTDHFAAFQAKLSESTIISQASLA